MQLARRIRGENMTGNASYTPAPKETTPKAAPKPQGLGMGKYGGGKSGGLGKSPHPQKGLVVEESEESDEIEE